MKLFNRQYYSKVIQKLKTIQDLELPITFMIWGLFIN